MSGCLGYWHHCIAASTCLILHDTFAAYTHMRTDEHIAVAMLCSVVHHPALAAAADDDAAAGRHWWLALPGPV
jgi:hypothetical protein